MDRQEIGLYLSATVRQRGLHTDYFVENNLNPIPTSTGLNQTIYSYHVTQAGRNRVKCAATVFVYA